MNGMRQGPFVVNPGRFGAIQPAPGPPPLQPIAPAPPGYPRPDEPFGGVTPLDESLPRHIQRAYAERAQREGGYGGIDVTVPIGMPSASPNAHQGEFGSEFSPPGQEYHQSPQSASGSSFTMGQSHGEAGSVFGGSHSAFAGPPQQGQNRGPSSSFSPPAHQSSGNMCPFNPPIPEQYITSRKPSAQSAQGFHDGFKNEDGADRRLPPLILR